MTLKISDDHMELEVAGTTIAGARVLADGSRSHGLARLALGSVASLATTRGRACVRRWHSSWHRQPKH